MKANINRVVSRLEDIYQCGKKEDGTYTRMAFSEEDVKGRDPGRNHCCCRTASVRCH